MFLLDEELEVGQKDSLDLKEGEKIVEKEAQKRPDIGLKAWYIVNTYAGHESKVKENLEARRKSMGKEDQIFRIVNVVETIQTKTATGKIKETEKNMYPGYVFVEMIMTDDSWYVVRNTPGVTGIAGSSGQGTKPTPVPTNEMESVLKRAGIIDEEMFSKYQVGDKVKVIAGTFNGLEGDIVEIKENNTVVINAVFFGRPTRVDVEFNIIEKI